MGQNCYGPKWYGLKLSWVDFDMGRFSYYGPKLSWADFDMGRFSYGPKWPVTIAPLKKDGINSLEPTDQVAILNEQFVSAVTKEDCTSVYVQNMFLPNIFQINGYILRKFC